MDIELSRDTSITPERLRELVDEITAGYRPEPTNIPEFVSARPSVSAEWGRHWGLRRQYPPFARLDPLDERYLSTLLRYTGSPLYAFTWDADMYEKSTGFWGEALVTVHGYIARMAELEQLDEIPYWYPPGYSLRNGCNEDGRLL